jgi:hypothetical protein
MLGVPYCLLHKSSRPIFRTRHSPKPFTFESRQSWCLERHRAAWCLTHWGDACVIETHIIEGAEGRQARLGEHRPTFFAYATKAVCRRPLYSV